MLFGYRSSSTPSSHHHLLHHHHRLHQHYMSAQQHTTGAKPPLTMVHFTIHKTGPTCTATAEGLRHHQSLSARGIAFQPGELRSSDKKAPCLTAAKSKGTPQPSWISEQGHQITIPSACSSPSIGCSPSCSTFTTSGASTRTKLFRQQLRKSYCRTDSL